MRLELRRSAVDAVVAAATTRLSGTRLEIDLEALRALLAADVRLERVRLDLAHPGERCRIGRVFDVVAPRAKLDGGGHLTVMDGQVQMVRMGLTSARAACEA